MWNGQGWICMWNVKCRYYLEKVKRKNSSHGIPHAYMSKHLEWLYFFSTIKIHLSLQIKLWGGYDLESKRNKTQMKQWVNFNFLFAICHRSLYIMKLLQPMLHFSFITLIQSNSQIKSWERKGLKDDRSEGLEKSYKKSYLLHNTKVKIKYKIYDS